MTGDTLAADLLRHPRLAAFGADTQGLVLCRPDDTRTPVLGIFGGHWLVVETPGTPGAWWNPPTLHAAGWQLDLDSHATAGVLLGALAQSWQVQTDAHGPAVTVWRAGSPVREFTGPTLAHAAGLALLAVEPLSEVARG